MFLNSIQAKRSTLLRTYKSWLFLPDETISSANLAATLISLSLYLDIESRYNRLGNMLKRPTSWKKNHSTNFWEPEDVADTKLYPIIFLFSFFCD